ncbi:type II secretion system F family protein [Falsiroseomonas sp. E2-1-a20]|uniref:type II secretion system F family protein n=1 Tax=Falsiroseomonas sp. E2-1-a20 TaxID=3239300 RepID=UPI003F39212C
MSLALALLIALPLLLSLLLGGLALIHGGTGRALRERVRSLSQAAPQGAAVALPSIRVGGSRHGALAMRIFRFLRFNPDMPQEQVIAWPLVALIGVLATIGAAFLLGGILGQAPALLAAPMIGVLAARGIFGWQHARYCEQVFVQIPDALGLMVRALRAGLPLAEALRGISREMPAPTRDEFARVIGDMAIGRPIEAALARLHERTGLTEYAFLAVTLGLQAQTGGSLAETLDNLSEMVRKRVAMARRAQAMAGEAKAQAALLLVLPFVAALGMSAMQPFYISAFTENPTGRTMALTGFGMMILGVLSIRWLIRQAGRD